MGAMPNEPSMEEILSSIKRIIAEEDVASPSLPRAPRRASPSATPAAAVQLADDEFADDDQILELTDALPGDSDAESAQEEPAMTAPANPAPVAPQAAAKVESKPAKPARAKAAAASIESAPAPTPGVMSDMSAEAARESLVNLSKLLIRPDDGQSNTLESLVREMLRPMLKEWLDAKLPDLVQGMVKREIDRITGRV
jgi:cell pole-organizing protein PopZ